MTTDHDPTNSDDAGTPASCVVSMFAVLSLFVAAPDPASAAPIVTTPIDKPTVIVYGDSLSVEAQGYFRWYLGIRFTPVIEVVSGTSPCDHFVNMRERAARGERPAMVVLVFAGNGKAESPCISQQPRSSQPTGEVYRSDLAAATRLWTRLGVPVTLVAGPPVVPGPGRDELVARVDDVRAAIVAMGTSTGALVIDSASPFTTNGTATMTMPCQSWEGCKGQIIVRSPDGLHFCPTGPSPDPDYMKDPLLALTSAVCVDRSGSAIYNRRCPSVRLGDFVGHPQLSLTIGRTVATSTNVAPRPKITDSPYMALPALARERSDYGTSR